HGAIPLVKNLLMAGLALSGAVFLLPMIVEWRWISLRFGKHVGRSFRKTIGDIVQLFLIGLVIDQCARGQRCGQQRPKLETLAVSISIAHCATPWILEWAGSSCVKLRICSKAKTGSFRGTASARLNVRTKTATTNAAQPAVMASSYTPIF